MFSKYCPISNLSHISKITERAVNICLINHLTSNHLLHPNQSACTKYHSTQTTILSCYNHPSNYAVSRQQVSCQFLLDLSAAFDNIGDSTLIHHLSSWFGKSYSVLAQFVSYLASHSFSILIDGHSSFIPPSLRLSSAIYLLICTPPDTACSLLNHHFLIIYKIDDIQLLISFIPKNFSITISHLEATIASIFFWMTAHLLTLNLSKTEFMLIGLLQHLSKIIHHSFLIPYHKSHIVLLATSSSCLNASLSFTCYQQIFSASSTCHYTSVISVVLDLHFGLQNHFFSYCFTPTFLSQLLQLPLLLHPQAYALLLPPTPCATYSRIVSWRLHFFGGST